MNDLGFDENTINKVKNMMDNGELSDVMSKITPEMLQNFSSILGTSENSTNTANSASNSKASGSSNFDFSNIDMNTVLKMKSVIEKMNNKNDPRSNLLYSLKPYLREEKRGKVDQYANLINIAKMAEIFKNDNDKENNK